jgi:beta-xylosidase
VRRSGSTIRRRAMLTAHDGQDDRSTLRHSIGAARSRRPRGPRDHVRAHDG